MGRTALYNISNIAVALSAQINNRQHIVQQFSRRANERFALKILLLTGTFTDEHHICRLGTNTEYHVMPFFAQAAIGAAEAGLLKIFPIQHISILFPVPFCGGGDDFLQ